MDQSPGIEIHLSSECKNESRVAHDAKECGHMNYHPIGEAFSHPSAEIYSCQNSDEGNFNSQSIKQEHLSDQSDASLDDSSEDLSDSEEFADLLQRCYSKSESDVMMQSADGNRETAGDYNEELAVRKMSECSESMRQCSSIYALKDHSKDAHSCTGFDVKSTLTQQMNHVPQDKMTRSNCGSSKCRSNQSHTRSVHLEEKLYKCPQCDSCFAKKYRLTQHISAVHNHEKPYECNMCELKFSKRSNLKRHQSAVHAGVKPYACDKCEFKSSNQTDLKQHHIAVHYQQKLYSCAECGKEFSQLSRRNRHIDAMHSGLKPHTCTECGRNFSENGVLKKHIKAVHCKERSHSCLECGKSFYSMSDLKRHAVAVHHGYNL